MDSIEKSKTSVVELHVFAINDVEATQIQTKLAEFCENFGFAAVRIFWRETEWDDIATLEENS